MNTGNNPQESPVVKRANEIISAHCAYLAKYSAEARRKSDEYLAKIEQSNCEEEEKSDPTARVDLLTPTSELPHKPWEVKWAIITDIIFDQKVYEKDVQHLHMAFSIWSGLKYFVDKEKIATLRASLESPEHPQHQEANEYIDSIAFSHETDLAEFYDSMLADVAPKLYSKFLDEMSQVLARRN